MERPQRTTFEQFWSLYTARSDSRRWVAPQDLCDHLVVDMLREWPLERLVESAPVKMCRTPTALDLQLQGWLRELKEADAVHRPTAPEVVRHRAAPRRAPHSLSYWNADGPNGGLRRWG